MVKNFHKSILKKEILVIFKKFPYQDFTELNFMINFMKTSLSEIVKLRISVRNFFKKNFFLVIFFLLNFFRRKSVEIFLRMGEAEKRPLKWTFHVDLRELIGIQQDENCFSLSYT